MSVLRPDDEFQSRTPKESISEEVHASLHVSEGWLVSYADMMTLLFGLFVILFAIASDKTKNVEKVMAQVSQDYFNGKPAVPKPVELMKAPVEAPPAITPIVPKADLEVNALKLEELEKENKSLMDQLEALKDKLASLGDEKKTLSKRVAELEMVSKAVSKGEESKREPDSAPVISQQDYDDVKAKLEAATTENDKLKARPVPQNYLMVILKWETEKHDLDLEIQSPHNKTFNFKKRKVAGEVGQFEIDSRYGPGIEMWKAENFTPGQYKAHISFYNANGNEKPAVARLNIITNSGSTTSQPITFNAKGEAQDLDFSVTPDGDITLQQDPK